MRRTFWILAAAQSLALCACGGDEDRDATTAASGSGIGSASAPQSTDTDIPVDTEAEEVSSGDPETTTEDPTDDPPSEPDPCNSGGDIEFSYIWIANSPEGTVSKIDTQTAIEVARYRTGPGEPDPSRTSVNLDGDVAVLNRAGGVAKIAAIEERCVDVNGDGVISTSTGPDDILAWGDDECILWYQDLPFVPDPDGGNAWGPRPIGWDQGMTSPDSTSCERFGETVWVGWFTGYDQNAGVFRRLDGDDGSTLSEVEVSEWAPLPIEAIRPYGGAIDAAGDFWALGKGSKLIRIDAHTLAIDTYQGPALAEFYGLALDGNGESWVGSCDGNLYHLNLASGNIETVGNAGGCLRGLQIDREGRGFIAANDPCRLVEFDTLTGTLSNTNIALPGCETPVGVSIDFEGFVWVVDKDADKAFKVDPDTQTIVAEVPGLVGPYTYSDMTGAGLRLVTTPEG